jgi:hypothetical protein
MSEEDTQATSESEVRGAELRENLAMADARRAEEEVARVHAEADRMRAAADATAAAAAAPRVTPPLVTEEPAGPAQRPEVLIGATFVGAFLAARILKRIFD